MYIYGPIHYFSVRFLLYVTLSWLGKIVPPYFLCMNLCCCLLDTSLTVFHVFSASYAVLYQSVSER